MERNMASRDTTIVKKPNGYGSNIGIPGIHPVLIKIQEAKNIT
jgi:hypothetical protein